MTAAFFEGLPGDFEVARFDAFTQNAEPCDDCRVCFDHNRCKHSDLDEFFAAFENAGIFLIATPVYNMSVPAPAKAVTDRFQRYYNAWKSGVAGDDALIVPQASQKKRAILLTASGSNEPDGARHIAQMLRRLFTVTDTELIACFDVFGTDHKPVDGAVLEDIRRFARTL